MKGFEKMRGDRYLWKTFRGEEESICLHDRYDFVGLKYSLLLIALISIASSLI